jgi:hypothetical protein
MKFVWYVLALVFAGVIGGGVVAGFLTLSDDGAVTPPASVSMPYTNNVAATVSPQTTSIPASTPVAAATPTVILVPATATPTSTPVPTATPIPPTSTLTLEGVVVRDRLAREAYCRQLKKGRDLPERFQEKGLKRAPVTLCGEALPTKAAPVFAPASTPSSSQRRVPSEQEIASFCLANPGICLDVEQSFGGDPVVYCRKKTPLPLAAEEECRAYGVIP